MKERPIIFSAPMVRAILEGRKTQTRRIAKFTDAGHVKEPRGHRRWHPDDPDAVLACPYGQPGDRLWVRETWNGTQGEGVAYRATDHHMNGEPWRPSIHMPRRASRILLEIVSVRVERLQAISEADAEAEGVAEKGERLIGVTPYRARFFKLWEQIHGHGSWEANPHVWAIEFKRIQPA